MLLNKRSIQTAMSLTGFEHWRPAVDVPELNRPRRRPDELPGQGRKAAVMLLLYPNPHANGKPDLKLVLTRRHEHLNQHAGQISLPGGRQDEGESIRATALRETTEEIGVDADSIELLGELNPVYIPPSDFTVTPFVGWIAQQPGFVRSESEVDEIIEASVEHLLKPETMVRGPVQTPEGPDLEVPYYQVEHYQVWGATALMLGEFIERVNRVFRT